MEPVSKATLFKSTPDLFEHVCKALFRLVNSHVNLIWLVENKRTDGDR